MKRTRPSLTKNKLALIIATILISPAASLGQVSGANIFIVGGNELNEMASTSLRDLAGTVGEKLWVVADPEIGGLKTSLQVGVMPSASASHEGEWMIEHSEPFELRTKLDAEETGGKMLLGYAGYYAKEMVDVLPKERLLELFEKAGYKGDLPVKVGSDFLSSRSVRSIPGYPWYDAKSGVIPISVPCCKPADEKMLMRALDEVGLVGEKGLVMENGVVKEGHLLLTLLPGLYGGDETKAPMFGERRKGVKGLAIVLTTSRGK